MWRRVSCTRIYGCSCRLFAWCARLWGAPPSNLFFIFTPLTHLSWSADIPWSAEGSVLFKAFTTSYKNFKERFFKVLVESEGTSHFFDAVGPPRFPLFWTRSPAKIKDWPRPVNPSDGEREVFALFDSLPMKLPARLLMSLYVETDRKTAFEGTFEIFRPSVVHYMFVTNILFLLQ